MNQNNQLPADVQERIKTDARNASDKRYEGGAVNFEYLEYEAGWEEGAMEMAQNVQQAIVLMQEIIKISDRKHNAWDRAKEFLQQWKEGKGGRETDT